MSSTNKATLTRHRIRELTDCIKASRPVAPESELWSLADCLTVAGVLLSSAMAAGNYSRTAEMGNRERHNDRLKEFQAAIEFVAAMTTAHRNGTWDDYFESAVTVGIGAGRCTPLCGFKR